MKLTLAATEPSGDAELAIRFGRGPFLIVFDIRTNAFEVFENPYVNIRGTVYSGLVELIAVELVALD